MAQVVVRDVEIGFHAHFTQACVQDGSCANAVCVKVWNDRDLPILRSHHL